jgi:curved DNA-binding protein CbpA
VKHSKPRNEDQRPSRPETKQALVDPYQVLGLPRQATPEDIKKAYFAQVREHPPETDPDQFKVIRAAYDALRTPEAKSATDLFLLHPPVPYEPYKRPPGYDVAFHETDWLVLARAYSDLERTDFREDFREITL